MIKFEGLPGSDFTKLGNYQEITDFLMDTKCDIHELGPSSNDDEVYGLSVGDTSKPMILVDGTMHGGHEWTCTHWVKAFIEMIADPPNNYWKPFIEKMRAEFCFFAIPCLNTYGYLNNSYLNANGVNLNRNFPLGWDKYRTDEPGHSQYKGPEPFSEPESKMIKEFVEKYKVVGYVNCHTWGGYKGHVFETSSTVKEFRTLLDDISDSIQITFPDFEKVMRYRNGPSTPWVTEWMGDESSKLGKDILCVIYEVGSEESNYNKSKLGVTSLLIYSYYIYKWFRERKLVLN